MSAFADFQTERPFARSTAVGRVPVLRWRDRMTGVGHIAAIPDLAVSFTRQTGRPVTCAGHP